jgi:cobyrinic acid a,c-diamide synthase
VAGTHSGVGKTTIATGLMAALARRGHTVASAKVGPDFIDPGYHSIATGRSGRNLDPWMSGPAAVAPLAAGAAAGADVLVVEGVMGLFDGAADGTPSSTAEVAKLLAAPVVLVVDAASMSQSVAAVVHGYRTWDPGVHLAGVVLNRVGSDSHENMLRAALDTSGVAVLGAVRRDDALGWRSRHLGLLPVAEDPAGVRASIDRLAAVIDRSCDLDALMAVAAAAAPLRTLALPRPVPGGPVRVAVAAGAAFSFTYPENIEALEAAGAEVTPFDPCADMGLPDGTQAVVAGGGFPEVFAEALAANTPMLAAVRAHDRRGGVTWAECGGLLWLAASLDGRPMAGVVDTTATLTDRRELGYRTATTTAPSPLGPVGTALRGHEFHYSTTDPAGTALTLTGRTGTTCGGFATPRLLASYLHVHLAAAPALVEAFVAAAATVGSAGARTVA